ncbi:sigma-54-dependent transcriptional regulator [Fulvivirga sediminis]|uniref:Sigma-54-dependent Fis family transcriptional regulator n=1 Tax=Fulvivirga sediminis TaxID=2803949 RepID=A0A937K2A2_9BACT|nr:sigma-54 dependent transcriptional regulator [Fulvivirga sediminis]MBL3657582.1 sigma-54-dependent Fis family transcriptional regulator [Fulvivirga sediminis]
MEKILIIDDDNDICLLLNKFLTKKNYEVDYATTGEEGIRILKKKTFDLVISDYRLPDEDGISILRKIKIISPETAVIIITGYSDVRIAVQTLKHGAYDYVTKPLYPDEILVTVKEAIRQKKEQNDPEPSKGGSGSKKVSPNKKKNFVAGKSSQSEIVHKHITLIAPTDMSVIITGETGTGKEFVANEIHNKSKRVDKPFVAIDCGALPKELAGSELFGHMKGAFTGALADKPGSFEIANGGTLFLDEIGNLSYENQIKLLRVLQERKIKRVGGVKDLDIDVRVIAATNEDLKEAVRNGKFREDLYHRLNEFRIELSPLRERKPDILIFARHFLELANAQLDKNIEAFEPEVEDKLKNYYWHGNLRELQNVVKRAVLLCQSDKVSLECLPSEIISPDYLTASLSNGEPASTDVTNLKSVSENAERNAIISVLEKTGYNKTKAAEVLNIDRKTLYNKLKAYDINI